MLLLIDQRVGKALANPENRGILEGVARYVYGQQLTEAAPNW